MKTGVCLTEKSERPVSLPTAISRKNSKRYLSELAKFAGALGVTMKDLFIEGGDRPRITYMHIKLMDRLTESLNAKMGR